MPRYIDANEFRKRIDHYPPDIRDTAKKELRYVPTADVVGRSTYNQVRWERDTAIEQLSEIGKGLGERMDDVEKVVRCKDCKFASYEPYKDFVNVYICNYSQWTRSEGGRYPDWYCARAERRTDDA